MIVCLQAPSMNARSAGWMLLATAAFTAMASIIKSRSADLGAADLLFLRLGFSAVWVALLQRFMRFQLKTRVPLLHVRRAALGCVAMGAWYHTLGVLPMGVSVTLNYMSPLFLGLFLLCGREQALRPSLGQMGLLGIGFAGVLLMMIPMGKAGASLEPVACTIGMLGALCGALAFKDVRVLKAAGESEWQMVFHFSLMGALISLPFTDLLHRPGVLRATDTAWLSLAGLFGALGQLGVSKAFGRGDPMVPASMQYLSVVYAVALGWMFFHESLGWAHLAGIALVVGGAAGTLVMGSRRPTD